MAECIGGLAAVMLARTQVQTAVRLWGAAHALRDSIGSPLYPQEQEKYEQQVRQTRSTLGEADFAILWNEGRSLTLEQAIEHASRASSHSR